MTSDLASEDLADLRAQGLTPSDDDIIRLHTLALRISDGQETTAANAPRWATAGGVVFFEPTLAARMWFEFARDFAEDATAEDWMFAFACAKGRDRGYLESLRDPADISRELGLFLAAFTGTKAEAERAVYFAAVGLDYVDAEPTDLAKLHAPPPGERERERLQAVESLLAAAAAATGLTYDDLLVQTPSRLRGMIFAAHVQAGLPMSRSGARAHAEYLATLAAIEKRLVAERSASAAGRSGSPLPAERSPSKPEVEVEQRNVANSSVNLNLQPQPSTSNL